MKRSRFFSILICLIFSPCLSGQTSNLGTPFINKFPKKVYNAGTQNWKIVHDKRGVVYFANNEGMLQFDGKKWACYPLPNKTIARSLAIDQSGIIYIGGQNELGYFAPDQKGDWAFHSLRETIPKKYRNFEDIWDIVINEQCVYFRASKWLYCYYEGKMSVLLPTEKSFFNFLGRIGKDVVIQDSKQGLKYVKDTSLIYIPDSKVLTHSPISNILPIGQNEWLITTLISGFFKFNGESFTRWQPKDNAFLRENKTYSSAVFQDGRLAFGTSLGGLLIVHPDGSTLHHLTKENGLLNNKILCIKADNQNNLWLGSDNGINYVLTGSPFTQFSPDGKAEGAGYSVIEDNGILYFGTANGLFSINRKVYYSPFDKTQFQQIEGTKGQVWGLNKIGDDLLLGHHSGGYLIENGKTEKITPNWGYWSFKAQPSNQMIAGTYKGLVVFNEEIEKWKFQHNLTGFEESSRFLEQDISGNIWIAHPYKGIFKLSPDIDLKKVNVRMYGAEDGLPSNLSNYVFKIKNEIIFCGAKGVFTYDASSDRFQPYPDFNQIFGPNEGVRRLYESPDGNIWFVSERDVGILKIQEKSIKKEIHKVSFPQLFEHLVNGFELIYPLDRENVFIGTEEGFIHYNPQKQLSIDTLFQVVLNEVSTTINGDSLFFKGLFHSKTQLQKEQPTNMVLEFPPNLNAFRFAYSATDFSAPEAIQFKIYLEGLEENWSEWTLKSEKEYTNLEAGNYTIHLKAKNQQGVETKVLTYQFIIRPYWYATPLAYCIYLLTLLGIVTLGFSFFNKKYRTQKKKVELTKKEVSRLKNEKLESEIAHKNRELASATIHLIHKNDILSQIKTSLTKIEKQIKDQPYSKDFKRVVKLLNQEENSETNWEQFIAHFNDIHVGFFEQLKERYPTLSPKDLKMCAYLRMNLSTKEIATLLNISIRGVEGGRYRLRKRMGLDNSANLVEFILNF